MLDSQVCFLIFVYVCETCSECWLFYFFCHVLPHQYEKLTLVLSLYLKTLNPNIPDHSKDTAVIMRIKGKYITHVFSFGALMVTLSFNSGLSLLIKGFSEDSYLGMEMICQPR